MLFNSLSYLVFLPVVFFAYWMLSAKGPRLQNVLLLAASYFFYGCWDWRFLILLLFSTGLDFYTGSKIAGSDSLKSKKSWLWISIGVNLSFLGVFKYYDFFASSLSEGLSVVGIDADLPLLRVILPVGISFYTFHGLSYVIDIYHDRIRPERNPVDYALFVSYFPLLVAGPIERATHLLPQLKRKRVFNYDQAMEGVYQLAWGFFKKLVIADTCALYADAIFDDTAHMNSVTLALGAVYFSFQIYGDFSGYSDIALGTSKLFGIELLRNFNYPYFSRDIAEFWRRWHISLSSWFRDYLYIPLGGNKGPLGRRIRNTFIIFIVSGFWHGAKWTFIVWGGLNALFFLPLLITGRNRRNLDIVAAGKAWPGWKTVFDMIVTFSLTTFAWIFFRSNTLQDAFDFISRMFTAGFQGRFEYLDNERYSPELLPLILLFTMIEWHCRESVHPVTGRFRTAKLILIIISIMILGVFSEASEFIYFQF